MTGYQAGWAKREIAVSPRGHAMQGYGRWTHRARGARTPLYARALYLRDADGRAVALCCLDLGYVTHSMRAGVTEALGADFDPETLVLTCTHTHSGPGGCGHEALYNVVVPGFVPEHLRAVVEACVGAITEARDSAAPTDLGLANGPIPDNVPVAWNRALRAYNRNPDVTPRATRETHLAINRDMQVLALRRGGELRSLLSLFGVHATCVGNTLPNYTGDNKGYAAEAADAALAPTHGPASGASPIKPGLGESATIFAQSTAGDVSPYYHGPGQRDLRRSVSGEVEYTYAEHNGRRQSDHALTLAADTVPLSGNIDGVLSYVDFTAVRADPAFTGGAEDAWTSDPCHGVAFFAGTPVDGRGLPAAAIRFVRSLTDRLRQRRLRAGEPYYQRLYAAQDPKAIMMEAGRKLVLGRSLATFGLPSFVDPSIAELKRQARVGAITDSPLVPTVLPVQLITIGTLALVCAPGEFTTTAGRRLVSTVRDALPGVENVWIMTYCNDYMGYVTTHQEYEEQCYEGGHTMFGKWTLAAFQTCFAALAEQLAKPREEREHDRTTRPAPLPAAELALRSDLPLPVHKGR